MSKNIIIQEGGIAKQMTVNKLKTDKVGGGSCLWVPEDEVSLGTKSISQNGTYKASDDGKYGYSQVTVNISGTQGSVKSDGTPNTDPIDPNNPDSKVNPGGPGTSIVGTDPVTGNDYIIGVDEDGQLVTTPVPSKIEITENPTVTDYEDGDTPNYTGIVATLKNNDGTTFTNEDYPDGTIPISELILPTTSVDVDEASTVNGMTSELPTNIAQPIHVYSGAVARGEWNSITTYGGGVAIPNTKGSDGQVGGMIAASSPQVHKSITRMKGDETIIVYDGTYSLGDSYTYDNKTVYYMGDNQLFYSYDHSATYDGIEFNGKLADKYSCWTAVYGNPQGGTVQLPVKWKSLYDGRTFETNVEVSVNSSGFSDDSGGSSSGGGTGV